MELVKIGYNLADYNQYFENIIDYSSSLLHSDDESSYDLWSLYGTVANSRGS